MKRIILFFLFLSISFAKYSYSDSCYRYIQSDSPTYKSYLQYYVNKKGVPLSNDLVMHAYTPGDENHLSVQYYYHQVLSNCTTSGNDIKCVSTTKSVWFKVVNATAAQLIVTSCDPVFYKKYADITEYKCSKDGKDAFEPLYKLIGYTTSFSITMEHGVPEFKGLKPDGECVWEYEILGLWSIVAIVVVSSCIVGALLFIVVIWIIAQKHRSNKRKRLDNALINNKETGV